jgi:hypothetical protein
MFAAHGQLEERIAQNKKNMRLAGQKYGKSLSSMRPPALTDGQVSERALFAVLAGAYHSPHSLSVRYNDACVTGTSTLLWLQMS